MMSIWAQKRQQQQKINKMKYKQNTLITISTEKTEKTWSTYTYAHNAHTHVVNPVQSSPVQSRVQVLQRPPRMTANRSLPLKATTPELRTATSLLTRLYFNKTSRSGQETTPTNTPPTKLIINAAQLYRASCFRF